MSLKRRAVAVMVSICAFAALANAQKNELTGIVGRTLISDQTITASSLTDNKLRFGNGLSFEVNYARRMMDLGLLSLSLEVPFLLNPDEDLHAALPSQVPESYKSYFVTPAARLNVFPDLAVSPWVSVGGGVGHFTQSSHFLFGGKNTGKATTGGVFQAGVGLDVHFWSRFSLRGELRDFWSAEPQFNVNTGNSRQHNLFAGGGVVWHF
jgi:hypothetical protein